MANWFWQARLIVYLNFFFTRMNPPHWYTVRHAIASARFQLHPNWVIITTIAATATAQRSQYNLMTFIHLSFRLLYFYHIRKYEFSSLHFIEVCGENALMTSIWLCSAAGSTQTAWRGSLVFTHAVTCASNRMRCVNSFPWAHCKCYQKLYSRWYFPDSRFVTDGNSNGSQPMSFPFTLCIINFNCTLHAVHVRCVVAHLLRHSPILYINHPPAMGSASHTHSKSFMAIGKIKAIHGHRKNKSEQGNETMRK